MNREEFVLHEYVSIREEIRDTKARIFKLAGFGIVAMPTANYLAHTYDIRVITLSLPILICTIVILFLAESRALMRCGKYIREIIEPMMADDDGHVGVGWETWLQRKEKGEPDRRLVDKLVAFFFYILFLFYYSAAVYLAAGSANCSYGMPGLSICLGFYIGIGLIFIVALITNLKYSSSTDH